MIRLDWSPANDVQRAAGVRRIRRTLGERPPRTSSGSQPEHWGWDSLPFQVIDLINYSRTVYELRGNGGSSWEIDLELFYLPALSTQLLTAALEDPDYRTARLAAEVLRKSPRPAALPALAASHAYNDAKVCHSAIEALAKLADIGGVAEACRAAVGDIARYTEEVRPGQENLDFLTRRKAVEILGKIPGAIAADALQRATQDSDKYVRVQAIETLAYVKTADRESASLLAMAADGPIETWFEERYRGWTMLVGVPGGPVVEVGDLVRSVATLDAPRCVNVLLAVVQAAELDHHGGLGLDAVALLEQFLRRAAAAVPNGVLRQVEALPAKREYHPMVSTGEGGWNVDRSCHFILDFTGVRALAQAELARRAVGTGMNQPS